MKLIQIKGQISLFDDQPKTINIPLPKEETKDNTVFLNLIDKYRNLCARIARVEDKLYIEIDDKTLSFNQDGELSGIFIKDMLLRPKDEIIVANEYKPITEEQKQTLQKIKTDKFIKRKSDNNILIQFDKFCIAIYPTGHFAKWESPAIYKENEVHSVTEIENINKLYEESKTDLKVQDNFFKIGDKVKFMYSGETKEGIVKRIYNNHETINVEWDGKVTAFYYKKVERVS